MFSHHSHTSKAEFGLCACSEQTVDFYCLDKTMISVNNSFVHTKLELLDFLFYEIAAIRGGISGM